MAAKAGDGICAGMCAGICAGMLYALGGAGPAPHAQLPTSRRMTAKGMLLLCSCVCDSSVHAGAGPHVRKLQRFHSLRDAVGNCFHLVVK